MAKTKIPHSIRDIFDASSVALSLTDPRQSDDPVVLVNDAFCHMSGYESDEVLGKNCRFMQGTKPQEQIRKTIRMNVEAGRDTHVLMSNRKKNGDVFDNLLFIFSLNDSKGVPLFRVGSQFEVPAKNRNSAFLEHMDALRRTVETLNAHCDAVPHQMINLSEFEGISIKTLLNARLETLKL